MSSVLQHTTKQKDGIPACTSAWCNPGRLLCSPCNISLAILARLLCMPVVAHRTSLCIPVSSHSVDTLHGKNGEPAQGRKGSRNASEHQVASVSAERRVQSQQARTGWRKAGRTTGNLHESLQHACSLHDFQGESVLLIVSMFLKGPWPPLLPLLLLGSAGAAAFDERCAAAEVGAGCSAAVLAASLPLLPLPLVRSVSMSRGPSWYSSPWKICCRTLLCSCSPEGTKKQQHL